MLCTHSLTTPRRLLSATPHPLEGPDMKGPPRAPWTRRAGTRLSAESRPSLARRRRFCRRRVNQRRHRQVFRASRLTTALQQRVIVAIHCVGPHSSASGAHFNHWGERDSARAIALLSRTRKGQEDVISSRARPCIGRASESTAARFPSPGHRYSRHGGDPADQRRSAGRQCAGTAYRSSADGQQLHDHASGEQHWVENGVGDPSSGQ